MGRLLWNSLMRLMCLGKTCCFLWILHLFRHPVFWRENEVSEQLWWQGLQLLDVKLAFNSQAFFVVSCWCWSLEDLSWMQVRRSLVLQEWNFESALIPASLMRQVYLDHYRYEYCNILHKMCVFSIFFWRPQGTNHKKHEKTTRPGP